MGNLLDVFHKILSFSSADTLGDLNEVHNRIDSCTAPAVLAFFNALLENEAVLTFRDPEEEMVSNIREKLSVCLSNNLKHLVLNKKIKSPAKSEQNKEPEDIFEKCKKVILETLIRKSKYEISNNIDLFFNRDNPHKCTPDTLIESLLKYLKVVSAKDSVQILKEIVYNSTENDVNAILECFEDSPENFDILLLIFKFSRTNILELIYNAIYSEKKYFKRSLVSALPDIDHDKVLPLIKDYNWDIAASLIESRPEIVIKFCNYFNEGLIGCTRAFFIEKMIEQDTIFSLYLQDLKLSSEEYLDLAARNKNMAMQYFSIVASEDDMLELTKIFSKKDQNFIIDFIKKHKTDDKIEAFVKCLTKTMRFTGDLKSFIIENFAKQEKYFHSLISYLRMDEIEALLTKYYVPELSVESLLRKMYPQELIIEISKFQDSALGLKLISDCINSSRFDDKDWVLAMKFLETVDSAIKFHMCNLIFTKKSNIKNQAITLLKRSINNSVWDNPLATSEIIKCIEALDEDCIYVFDAMTEEEVIFVFRKSTTTERRMKSFFKNFHGHFTPLLGFVDRCLRKL